MDKLFCRYCKDGEQKEKKDLDKGIWNFTCQSCGVVEEAIEHAFPLGSLELFIESKHTFFDTTVRPVFRPKLLGGSIEYIMELENKRYKVEVDIVDLESLVNRTKSIIENIRRINKNDNGTSRSTGSNKEAL